jgi:hypothetical protein
MTGIRVLNGAAAITVGGGKRDETATVLCEVIVRRRTKSTRTPLSTKPLELNISQSYATCDSRMESLSKEKYSRYVFSGFGALAVLLRCCV